jgi:hypothetical protein
MWRCLPVAILSLIVLALPVSAQRHGGGGGGGSHFASGGGHFASGGGFAAHSSGSVHSGSFDRASGVHVQVGNRAIGRRGISRRRSFYSYAPYYPYLGYYGFYSDLLGYQTNDSTEDSYADAYSPAPYREDDGLQRDVQALNQKIDRLQADVEARKRPNSDAEPETALVFRDQHVEQVRNYAIAGGTLWVFNDQSAKKIPLAALDLGATAKINDDRGVDFQVPK